MTFKYGETSTKRWGIPVVSMVSKFYTAKADSRNILKLTHKRIEWKDITRIKFDGLISQIKNWDPESLVTNSESHKLSKRTGTWLRSLPSIAMAFPVVELQCFYVNSKNTSISNLTHGTCFMLGNSILIITSCF